MNRNIKFALAALFLLALSGTANAWNSKSYNGSYCKPTYPASYYASGEDSLLALQTGLYNSSSSTVYVTCPLIVDEMVNTQGTYLVGLWWTDVGQLGFSLSCTIHSIELDGDISQSLSASTANTGWLFLPNITNEYVANSYVITCALRGQSAINGILVYEYN